MFCIRCGQFNSDDSKFCTNCSAPLATAEAPVQQAPTYEAPVQQQAPTYEAPVQQQAPVQQAPTFEAPVQQQAPVQQAPTYEVPVQQQAPVQQAPAFEVPVQQQAPVQQAPTYEAPVQQQAPVQPQTAAPEYAYSTAATIPTSPVTPVPPRKKSSLGKILAIAIPISVVLIVGIVLLFVFGIIGGAGPKDTLKKGMNALVSGDGKAFYTVFVDKYDLEYYINEEGYYDKQEVIEMFAEYAEEMLEDAEDEFGRNPKLESIEYLNTIQYSKDDIAIINAYLEEENENFKYGDLKDLYVYDTEVTFSGKEGSETMPKSSFVLYKIGNSWYIADDYFCGVDGIADADDIEYILNMYE